MSRKHASAGDLTALNVTLFALAFLLLAVRDGGTDRYILAVGCPAFLLVSGLLFPGVFRIDKTLLALTNFFSALSLLLAALAFPDQLLSHLLMLAAGYACLVLFLGLSCASPESPAVAGLFAFRLILSEYFTDRMFPPGLDAGDLEKACPYRQIQTYTDHQDHKGCAP